MKPLSLLTKWQRNQTAERAFAARIFLLMGFALLGCHSPAPAIAGLPKPVADAFHSDHGNITPTHVRARLYPDNQVHYQIRYLDGSGRIQQAEYVANGSRVQ